MKQVEGRRWKKGLFKGEVRMGNEEGKWVKVKEKERENKLMKGKGKWVREEGEGYFVFLQSDYLLRDKGG